MIAGAGLLLAVLGQDAGGAAPPRPPAVLERSPAELPRAPDAWAELYAADADPVSRLEPFLVRELELAEALHRAGRFPQALERLYGLLERSPDLPPAWLLMGTTYFRLRRYGDARTAYERFLEVAPGEAWRTQALGHCLYSLGQYEAARDHYARVLDGAPESLEALRGLALSHHRLGEDERALGLLRRVIERDPTHAEAVRWTGQILFGLDRAEDAHAFAARAFDLAPYDERAAFLLHQVLDDLGREDEAGEVRRRWRELDRAAQERRALESVLRIDPDRRELLWKLARLHAGTGDADSLYATVRRLLDAPQAPPEPRTEARDRAEVAADLEVRLFALRALGELGSPRTAELAAELEREHPDDRLAWEALHRHYLTVRDRVGQIRAERRLAELRRN